MCESWKRVFFELSCTIAHHSEVGNFNFFASGVTTGGAIKTGNNCFFGISSIIASGKKIADRLRNVRKRRSISQEKLANMSGVSYGSIKRFEATGQISLISLIKIATALGVADELRELFTDVPYRNIQEVINETK